jgi:hypothetical protein
MQPDPIIDQIREVRHRISEQCGHDPKRLVEYYMKLETEEYADRMAKMQQPAPKAKEEQ